jgi:tRNA U34 5-carboxymethylaminomethyl modifying GTPase MnmE/TrmE
LTLGLKNGKIYKRSKLKNMEIKSAEFIKGVVGDDNHLYNGIAQVALIGRSNVGKSSVINITQLFSCLTQY